MDEYRLVASDTRGRYALDDPQGPDISTGQPLSIKIGGQWVAGRVEHGAEYSNIGLKYLGDPGPESRTIQGYYFVAQSGDICGLCVGMRVRLVR